MYRPQAEPHAVDETEALSQELFQKIKSIQIRTQRLVTDVMAGEYESAFKGRGMEFEDVREYQPGDDIRHIDWKVTARTGTPHVKRHREERELTVMLMVDVSSSSSFGTAGKLKSEVAAEVAAILAYTAIRSHDRVGLIIFSDRIERYIPPKKGRAHVWRVIREILGFRPSRRNTDLDGALEFLSRISRRKAVVFLLSDFLDEGWADRLRIASRRHDLTAVPVLDPRERELPDVGLLELEDAETGETILVDTRDKNLSNGFRLLTRDDRRARDETFRSSGVGEIPIRTDENYVDSIIRFFRYRESHRR